MDLISELEAFQEARSLENYLHKSGQKKYVQMAPIFDKYKHILSKDALKSIKNLDKRENKFIYHSIVLNVINHAVASASDEESSAEASAKVNIDGMEVPLRQASIMLLNESDVHKRKKIVEAIQNSTKRARTSLEVQLQARQAAILQLTGKKYLEYLSWVKEVNFENLAKETLAVLAKTDTIHMRLMKKNVKKSGMTLSKITPEDWVHCTRAKEFDKWFPADSLLDSIKNVWRNFGCVFEKEVIVDFEDRPLKVPHAACHRIKVPQEIVIVARPRGGHIDYRTLLHESGHAMHYAYTGAGLHYAFRHLDGNAGNFLKSLWKWGRSAKSIPELAELIGYKKVSSRYIINYFTRCFEK